MRRITTLLFLTLVIIFGCETQRIQSRWIDRDITIDGIDTEWRGARFLIDKKYMTVGVMNDDKHLYLRLSTPNIAIQNLIAYNGMTLAIEAPWSKGEKLKITYPVGSANAEPDSLDSWDRDETDKRLKEKLENGYLVFEQKDSSQTLTVSEAEKQGILIGMSIEDDILVYELKIPVNRQVADLFKLNVEPGKSIGVGVNVDSAAKERPEDEYTRRNREANDRLTTYRRRPQQQARQIRMSLDFWVRVDLAKKI